MKTVINELKKTILSADSMHAIVVAVLTADASAENVKKFGTVAFEMINKWRLEMESD